MKITVLGARDSVATDGNEMTVYGGATSCVLVEAGNEAVFLDAGTGIVHAPDIGDRHISILITHPHIDHIVYSRSALFPLHNTAGQADRYLCGTKARP